MADYPITPPPELIKTWRDEWNESDQIVHSAYTHIALCAAQWGADMELEACCEWAQGYAECGDSLRIARRPKPPSLAEEALDELNLTSDSLGAIVSCAQVKLIRRALEKLQQLENNQ